jgi:hypothetical protein
MRRQLIEALTYPGILVRQLIEGGNYPHKSFYAATGERCHTCDGSGDCGWDKCLEDFVHRDDKSDEELADSLRETCSWIRNAEHLTEEFEHHLPHAEPDLHHFEHGETPPE